MLMAILKGAITIFIGFLCVLIFSSYYSQSDNAGLLFAILYLSGVVTMYGDMILKKIGEKK